MSGCVVLPVITGMTLGVDPDSCKWYYSGSQTWETEFMRLAAQYYLLPAGCDYLFLQIAIDDDDDHDHDHDHDDDDGGGGRGVV